MVMEEIAKNRFDETFHFGNHFAFSSGVKMSKHCSMLLFTEFAAYSFQCGYCRNFRYQQKRSLARDVKIVITRTRLRHCSCGIMQKRKKVHNIL